LEQRAVWIRQELIILERKADRMLLDPSLLTGQRLRLVGRGLDFDFAQIVSELVVGDDECVRAAGIVNAVRIIVVLRWCFDHDTHLSHFVQRCD